MTNQINERVLAEAKHIVFTHDTIRKTACIFGVSKSTIHNDMTKKLKGLSLMLYNETRKILQENFDEKHIRGGEATKAKYLIKEGR